MSLDKANNDDWNWIKAKDFMIFNPRESVKKGTSIKNIPMDKIEPKTKEISSYEITEFKGGVKFRNGDTLMARITPCLENGKISQVSILDYNEIGAGSTEFIVLREKEGVSDKDFIYYLSNSEFFKEPAIKSMVGSSGRQRVQRDVVENLEIYVPPLDTQKKIGKLLSYFDDKISLNKKINKNLFELSNVIYSDFIKSMDNNEQCHYIELKELGNIVMGQSPKGESYNYDNIGLPLINGAADYENGYLKAQKYTSDPKKTCNKNDLIFCIRATIGLLVVCDKKYCLGRGVAGITNINPIYKEYAFHLINSSIENFKRAATGSVISGISRKDIENIDVIIPSSDEINKYHTVQKPIFDKLENNRIEINNLIKLRDTLLPKLMSGEIDVSKINCDFENIAHFMILSFKKIIGYLGLYFIRFL